MGFILNRSCRILFNNSLLYLRPDQFILPKHKIPTLFVFRQVEFFEAV